MNFTQELKREKSKKLHRIISPMQQLVNYSIKHRGKFQFTFQDKIMIEALIIIWFISVLYESTRNKIPTAENHEGRTGRN